MLIRKLEKWRASEAFALLTEEFVRHNVIHQTLNTNLDDYQSRFHNEFQNILDEGMSLIAIDPTTKKLVGVLLATDLVKSTQIQAAKIDPSPLNALCDELKQNYLALHPRSVGEALLVDMVAVSQMYRAQGIYRKLRLKINEVALMHNYKYVVGELSSALTQKFLLEKMGHKAVTQIEYKTFFHCGNFPFAMIKEPSSIVFCEHKIS